MTKVKYMIKYCIMYKSVRADENVRLCAIAILAAIPIVIYGTSSYALKSEEDSIDDVKQAVEKHLNDDKEARFTPAVQEPKKKRSLNRHPNR